MVGKPRNFINGTKRNIGNVMQRVDHLDSSKSWVESNRHEKNAAKTKDLSSAYYNQKVPEINHAQDLRTTAIVPPFTSNSHEKNAVKTNDLSSAYYDQKVPEINHAQDLRTTAIVPPFTSDRHEKNAAKTNDLSSAYYNQKVPEINHAQDLRTTAIVPPFTSDCHEKNAVKTNDLSSVYYNQKVPEINHAQDLRTTTIVPPFTVKSSGSKAIEKLTVGLDFGTSNTSVGISNKTRVSLMLNDSGEAQTPSIVAFDGDRILIGNEITVSTMKPENIIFGVKRFLGRTHDELKQKTLWNKPFVIKTDGNRSLISIEGKQFTIEQIVAILFSKLKTTVEKYYGVLGGAVLTVPSSFGPSQRRALMDASVMADIPVLQLIEETTAAAIAFACRKFVETARNILIFQLGGGFFDVAIFRIAGHSIELLSSVASCDIGGEDLTQKIFKSVSKMQTRNSRNPNSSRLMMQLRSACEKAKKDLSFSESAVLKFNDDQPELSAEKFKSENKHFLRTIEILTTYYALGKAGLSAEKIDNYFTIGRAAVMPSVRNMLETLFGESKRKDIVNADDAAVTGAAILAEFLSGQSEMKLQLHGNQKIVKFPDGRKYKRKYKIDIIVRAQAVTGFSMNELVQMADEIRKCAVADDLLMAADEANVKLSEDILKVQDEIEELVEHADGGHVDGLMGLQQECQSLIDWISDAENINEKDFKKLQDSLQSIRNRLSEPTAHHKLHPIEGKAAISSDYSILRPTSTVQKHFKSSGNCAIGIDLGTTNSCVAAIIDGREEVFKNDYGQHLTPSCVAFTRKQILIGDKAKHLMNCGPENTIYSVKRIIGRKFDDPKTQEDIQRWPFKVESSESGRPLIKIDHRRETFNPEEISGLVLSYMRRLACKKLDEDVRDAVVTVPAYFNHVQRTATKTAAEIAGINVLHIINEPTAAAIAFGLKTKLAGNILVYDLGGGCCDVTVLNFNGSHFDVKAISGDTRLGGVDFTNRLVDYFIEKTNLGKDITHDRITMRKLWVECERAKKELSFGFHCRLLVENIGDRSPLELAINRLKFISLNKDLFDKTMHYVEDAIEEAGVQKENIHSVVLAGGSSRIPYIQEMLQNYFGRDVVKDCETPERLVVKGAAFYAAFLTAQQKAPEISLREVTPLSLGVQTRDGKTDFIIRRNTKIPLKRREFYCNAIDYQKTASFPVCQGEEVWFNDNECLGTFWLKITPRPCGTAKIDVWFGLDLDGILHVTATELNRKITESMEINLCGTLEKLDVGKLKKRLKDLTQKVEDERDVVHDLTLESIHSEHQQMARKCTGDTKLLEHNFNIEESRAADSVCNVCTSTKQFYDAHVRSPDVYPMQPNRQKGKVLIINNEFCGQGDRRHGSQVDVGNLENLWNQLGFQVRTERNLKGGDMRRSCREFALDSVNINVLVLIIMSHCWKRDRQVMICGEDNQKVSTQQIITFFTSENAPHLQGIPKVLMFQSCRGEDRDQDPGEWSLDADTRPDKYPERSDMLIVYPSQAGYGSFRNREIGSWLMNAVTTVFMRDAKDTHVLDMLTKVNQAISLKENNSYVQKGNQVSYLTKKLFLFPGWPRQ